MFNKFGTKYNDGIYDETINMPPVFQDIIAPTTEITLSGTPTSNSTGSSYIEKVTIELNSEDNENGIGVDTIYYSLDNDTTEILYLPYIEPIMINGVSNYTLNYYAVDKFGNQEEIQTTNFSLTELPETYKGNISGYIYEDDNNNGVKDTGEKTRAGWKVFIDQNGDNEIQHNSEPFQVTNNSGYYEFDSLTTGIYHVQVIPHQNWTVTNPTIEYYNINLSNGDVVTDKNFGNLKTKKK